MRRGGCVIVTIALCIVVNACNRVPAGIEPVITTDSYVPALREGGDIGSNIPPRHHEPLIFDSSPDNPTNLPIGTGPLAAAGQSNDDLFDFSDIEKARGADEELSEDALDKVSINFVDAPIAEVVRFVLGDTLGLNYTIDPAIAARVTLKTNTVVDRGDLLSMFEQVLDTYGIMMVPKPFGYALLMQGNGQLTLARANQPGVGTEIIELQSVSAAFIKGIVGQLSAEAKISDIGFGHVAISGTLAERAAIRSVIDEFDRDPFAGTVSAVFPINNGSPADVAKDLTDILAKSTKSEAGSESVSVVPLDRSQRLLVIARNGHQLEEVQAWLDRVDSEDEVTKNHLFVYYVEHGQAAEIASTIASIFAFAGAEAGSGGQDVVAPGFSATETSSQAESTDALRYDASNSQENEDQPSIDVEPIGKQRHAVSFGDKIRTTGDVRLTADPLSNAIYVTATKSDYDAIRRAMDRLDIPQRQVLIEATIAEVSLNDDLKYGVEYYFNNGEHTLRLFDGKRIAEAVVPGFSYALELSDANVVIHALQSITNVRVISSPQLMVLDRHAARLQVGDQVPIVERTAVSVTDPEAPIVSSVNLKDTGVILTVVPQIGAVGDVQLNVGQEVSNVIETRSSSIDSPTIQQRKIHSTVVVNSGHTIALGGLIRDKDTDRSAGLPFLSTLPVIGGLFGSKVQATERTELLVLITPHVVSNNEESAVVTAQLRAALEGIRENYGTGTITD